MQHFLTLTQIETRARELGVKPPQFCDAAGISQATWSRWMSSEQGPLAANLEKAQAALIRLETDALERLIKLHPEKAAELLAARRQGEAA